jgi:hypothetical protein
MRRLCFRVVFVVAVIGGCARVPPGSVTGTDKILVVSFTVRGALDINRQPSGNYYYVLINRTNNQFDPGPAPVVGPPWGNGFAAPETASAQGFVGFVRYSREEGATGVGVYSCQVGGQLLNPALGSFTPLGPPDNVQTPQPGDSTLSFQLDLARLPNANMRYLQINILATNVLPQGADNTTKYWDALGDGRNGTDTGTGGGLTNYVILDTETNQIVTNSQQVGGTQEPANDVRNGLGPVVDDATLDIVDWTIQLRDP